MKVRATALAAGLIALPFLAACHSSSSSAPNGSPALTVPSTSVTAPVNTPTDSLTPIPTRPVHPTHPAHTTARCTIHYQGGEPLPDPNCTPGAVLTTSTANVCSPGWASKHREYFTRAQREAAFARYGIVTTNPAGYGEYDHLIPLELGGSNSSKNLWPEPGKIPNAKDAIEDALHNAVCSGHASLAAAQQAIASDWTTAGTKVIEAGNGLKSSSSTTHTSAPVHHASAPPTHVVSHSAPPANCYPTTGGGNCYSKGEFCPKKDHNDSGVAKNGTSITCEQVGSRWRWE